MPTGIYYRPRTAEWLSKQKEKAILAHAPDPERRRIENYKKTVAARSSTWKSKLKGSKLPQYRKEIVRSYRLAEMAALRELGAYLASQVCDGVRIKEDGTVELIELKAKGDTLKPLQLEVQSKTKNYKVYPLPEKFFQKRSR